jgi:hypothetical protein
MTLETGTTDHEGTTGGTTQIKVRLPDDLVAQIDQRRENLGLSRTQWFENMIEWCLTHTETIERRSK